MIESGESESICIARLLESKKSEDQKYEKRVKIRASPFQRYEQPGGWNAKKGGRLV